MRLDLTVSVGYVRRRARGVVVDQWERRVSTAGLLVAGALVLLLLIWLVVPRVLDWFATL